jgi:hypothetical protein
LSRKFPASMRDDSSYAFTNDAEYLTAELNRGEGVRPQFEFSSGGFATVVPGDDLNADLMLISLLADHVSADWEFQPVGVSPTISQRADEPAEGPEIVLAQDNSGFGTVVVLPPDSRPKVLLLDRPDDAGTPVARNPSTIAAPRIMIGFVEFHKIQTPERKGVELQFTVVVDRYPGDQLEIGAYFFDTNGNPLKDLDAQYVSEKGNVYTKRIIEVDSNRYDDEEFILFIPYLQFDALSGGTHQLQAQIYVWAGPPFEERLVRGARQEFDLTLYKFTARSR